MDDKKKYRNVNIPADLWEMVSFVCSVRGLRHADYLDPILRVQVTADFTEEMVRVAKEHNLPLPATPRPAPPPRKRPGGG